MAAREWPYRPGQGYDTFDDPKARMPISFAGGGVNALVLSQIR